MLGLARGHVSVFNTRENLVRYHVGTTSVKFGQLQSDIYSLLGLEVSRSHLKVSESFQDVPVHQRERVKNHFAGEK